jgi:hypothetical protein
MDELTKRRLAHNEALFRAVNEEIDDQRESGGRRPYVCECVDPGCTQTIELTRPEYQAVRANADRFVVAPGHVLPEVEHVVATSSGYAVVEKDVPA